MSDEYDDDVSYDNPYRSEFDDDPAPEGTPVTQSRPTAVPEPKSAAPTAKGVDAADRFIPGKQGPPRSAAAPSSAAGRDAADRFIPGKMVATESGSSLESGDRITIIIFTVGTIATTLFGAFGAISMLSALGYGYRHGPPELLVVLFAIGFLAIMASNGILYVDKIKAIKRGRRAADP